MNYLYILSFVFVMSLAFGRVSSKYEGPDAGFTHNKKRVVVSEVEGAVDDGSIKWKRRHKKRKKSRRPQRGR